MRQHFAASQAAAQDSGWWLGLAGGLLLAAGLAPAALGQARPKPVIHGAVIRPPTHVDPAMRMTPAPHPHLTTPVVHPPVRTGGTLVVPK